MTEDTIRSTVEVECKSSPRQVKDLIASYLIFTIASGLDTSRMVDVYELLSTCYGYGYDMVSHYYNCVFRSGSSPSIFLFFYYFIIFKQLIPLSLPGARRPMVDPITYEPFTIAGRMGRLCKCFFLGKVIYNVITNLA